MTPLLSLNVSMARFFPLLSPPFPGHALPMLHKEIDIPLFLFVPFLELSRTLFSKTGPMVNSRQVDTSRNFQTLFPKLLFSSLPFSIYRDGRWAYSSEILGFRPRLSSELGFLSIVPSLSSLWIGLLYPGHPPRPADMISRPVMS